MRTSQLVTLCSVVVAALVFAAAPAAAQANAQADLGKTLFMRRSCSGCHRIGGGKMAGPDLGGVTQRRSVEWLRAWLKSPETMVMSDATGKALYKEWNKMKMPNLKLSDEEVDALIAYLKQETDKAASKS